MKPNLMDDRDVEIHADRLTKWMARTGPRVGDFVILSDGNLHRFAHDWGDAIQPTSGGDASFYFTSDGHMSMSGSLDPAIPKQRIRDTGSVQDGACWFFHHGISGAHRGVSCKVPCRIYVAD